MNFIPLTIIPPEGRAKPKDPTILVNMDLVFSIEIAFWHPVPCEDSVEGSRLYSEKPSYAFVVVKETRAEILALIDSKYVLKPRNENTETSAHE